MMSTSVGLITSWRNMVAMIGTLAFSETGHVMEGWNRNFVCSTTAASRSREYDLSS